MAVAPALVLSGGNALGAYHAGAWMALEAAGVEPGWISGASVGAVTAAIIAGTVPGQRGQALRRFWDQAASFRGVDAFVPEVFRRPLQMTEALSSRIFGSPGLFSLRAPDLTGADRRPGLFDAGAMRRLLADLIDFGRLDGGPTRLSVMTVDLATGEEHIFDSAEGPIALDHIMASAALLPDFPPVEVAGRLLVDGGLSANMPVDVVLNAALRRVTEERLAIFAVDLFPSAAPLPLGYAQASQRQSDLIFASQSKKMLKAQAALWRDHQPGGDVLLLAYEALQDETPLKAFDFSSHSLVRRWDAGMRDMQAQLAIWRALSHDTPGLTIHPPPKRR
jgi:NTE family protein